MMNDNTTVTMPLVDFADPEYIAIIQKENTK